jgi:uncharacterized repeat protein (TIGR01451 family)
MGQNSYINLRAALRALTLLVIALAGSAAYGGTIAVNSTAQKSSGTTSVCTLGAAIASANGNTNVDGCTISGGNTAPYTINIPAGTYTLTAVEATLSGPQSYGLPVINSEITLQGATSATTIIERSSAGGTPAFAFLVLEPSVSRLTVNDLTFRNGSQTGPGGAIEILGDPSVILSVSRCVFDSNSATAGDGGAIAAPNLAEVVSADSSFLNNSASGNGGAINGGANIGNSFFSGNSAVNGGAVQCAGGAFCSVTVLNSTFVFNQATSGNGGAISSSGGDIIQCAFNKNVANHGDGGAIQGGASYSVGDSMFDSNSATFGGGTGGHGGAVACSQCLVVGSTFTDNTADTAGGAYSGGGSRLANDTFFTNQAPTGGAVSSQNGNVYNNITVVRNTSGSTLAGGGIAFGDGDTVRNSIVAVNANTFHTPEDCLVAGTVTSQGHNLFGTACSFNFGATFVQGSGDQIGTVAFPIDPVLNISQTIGKTAGAPGHTEIVDVAQVLIGSPALDAGDPSPPGSGGTACRATDQLGTTRPVGPACDIGSYEAQQGGDKTTADVTVTNSASASSVNFGDNVTYTITVQNSGPDTATGLTLTDTIDPSTLVFLTSPPGWICTGLTAGHAGTLSCTGTSLDDTGSKPTFSLVVKTTAAGPLNNTVNISTTSNDPNVSNNQSMAQVTVGPAPDFSVTAPASSQTVQPGGTATYTVTVTPSNGFTGSVSWACTGLPAGAICSASPNPLAVSGSSPVQTTLTLQTLSPSRSFLPGVNWLPEQRRTVPVWPLTWVAASLIIMVLLKSRRMRVAAPVSVCLGLVLLLSVGCGGASPHQSGTPKGTYNITVTATSGQTSHSSTVTLVVGP